MTPRRRGQFVLLAAVVVVTAMVPMLLAYAQLDSVGGAVDAPDERRALADAERSLERSVGETTVALANRSAPARHDYVAGLTVDRLQPTRDNLASSATERGLAVDLATNDTAATRWAEASCPRGPDRVFGDCVVTDGVVTQTRADTTALVAVAVDVRVRGPDGDARATFVIRGVRGSVGGGD